MAVCYSRHRKAQRLAAAAHVDGRKAERREPARAAITLLVDLELALAGAELCCSAPVQHPVLVFHRAVLVVDRLREAEYLLRLAGDIGVQTLAGIDAVPAATDHGLAV